jgi:hypothetical protein
VWRGGDAAPAAEGNAPLRLGRPVPAQERAVPHGRALSPDPRPLRTRTELWLWITLRRGLSPCGAGRIGDADQVTRHPRVEAPPSPGRERTSRRAGPVRTQTAAVPGQPGRAEATGSDRRGPGGAWSRGSGTPSGPTFVFSIGVQGRPMTPRPFERPCPAGAHGSAAGTPAGPPDGSRCPAPPPLRSGRGGQEERGHPGTPDSAALHLLPLHCHSGAPQASPESIIPPLPKEERPRRAWPDLSRLWIPGSAAPPRNDSGEGQTG